MGRSAHAYAHGGRLILHGLLSDLNTAFWLIRYVLDVLTTGRAARLASVNSWKD